MTQNSDDLTPSELTTEATLTPRKRGPLARLGCGIVLVFWFVLLLFPCLLFTLATQEQISLTLGSAPEQVARLWLVMEDDGRGVALSWPSVQTNADGSALCVQTDVQYFFWQGQVDPSVYCSCYTRGTGGADWQPAQTTMDVCTAEHLAEAAAR